MTLLSVGNAATILQLNNGDATLSGNGSIVLDGSAVAGNDPNLLRIQGVAGGSGAHETDRQGPAKRSPEPAKSAPSRPRYRRS